MFNTKMHSPALLLLVAITAILFAEGCKKDKETAEEKITKVAVHLIGTNGSNFNKEFEAEDPDADGVWNTIPSLDIPANTVFNVHVHVYDGADEIDSEIESESNDHLFEYKVTGASVAIDGLDLDGNGKPFGINSKWSTLSASTGTVQIRLRHEPTDKNAADPGGEIDFDVTFPIKIQ